MDGNRTEKSEYKIDIRGLRLYAYHGFYPEENKLGQEFKIDLLLTVKHSPSLDVDKLDLSYWDVVETTKKLFTGKTFKLLETAAQTILEGIKIFPQIREARIHLKKLTPPIPVTVDYVGVIMEKIY